MPAYVIYLRKSRADIEAENHGEGETLARHRTALLALADRQLLANPQVYSEIVSGETIAARPVMQKLLTQVEQGMWAGVLVMEVERLARGDTIDQGIVAQAFKFSGTKIITPMKTYDPRNEFDEEYFEFGLFMSRREYKTTTRRMQRGRLASVKEGKFVGNVPPYGYQRVKISEDKGFTLTPIAAQANIVRLIFEWYVEGKLQPDGTRIPFGYTKIAHALEALHCPTMTGKKWCPATVKEIIGNPVYIGKVRWNRRPQITTIRDGQIQHTRPRGAEDTVTIADGLHPPIISEELFSAAQSILKSHLQSPTPKDTVLQNPLAKIVVCGLCGKAMIRKPYQNGSPDALVCTTQGCPNISCHLSFVETNLLLLLEDWFQAYSVQPAFSVTSSVDTELSVKQQQVETLQADLKTFEAQADLLCDLLEQGIYTITLFTERSQKLSSKIENTRCKLQEAEQQFALHQTPPVVLWPAFSKAMNIIELYKFCETAKEKNDLLKQVLAKVVYTKTQSGHWRNAPTDIFDLVIYPLLPKQSPLHGTSNG